MTVVDALAGPAPDHLAQLLVSGGLNLVSGQGAGTGSKLGDVAAAYREPTAQAFKGMAADRSGNRALAASLLKGLGKSDIDKLKREADQIAELTGRDPGKVFNDLLNQMLYKDPKSPQTVARENFKSRVLALVSDKDYTGNIKIHPEPAERTLRAYDQLKIDYPELYQKVSPGTPYLNEKITDEAVINQDGTISVQETKVTKLRDGQVYFNYMDNTWYSFDKAKNLLRPAIPAE